MDNSSPAAQNSTSFFPLMELPLEVVRHIVRHVSGPVTNDVVDEQSVSTLEDTFDMCRTHSRAYNILRTSFSAIVKDSCGDVKWDAIARLFANSVRILTIRDREDIPSFMASFADKEPELEALSLEYFPKVCNGMESISKVIISSADTLRALRFKAVEFDLRELIEHINHYISNLESLHICLVPRLSTWSFRRLVQNSSRHLRYLTLDGVRQFRWHNNDFFNLIRTVCPSLTHIAIWDMKECRSDHITYLAVSYGAQLLYFDYRIAEEVPLPATSVEEIAKECPNLQYWGIDTSLDASEARDCFEGCAISIKAIRLQSFQEYSEADLRTLPELFPNLCKLDFGQHYGNLNNTLEKVDAVFGDHLRVVRFSSYYVSSTNALLSLFLKCTGLRELSISIRYVDLGADTKHTELDQAVMDDVLHTIGGELRSFTWNIKHIYRDGREGLDDDQKTLSGAMLGEQLWRHCKKLEYACICGMRPKALYLDEYYRVFYYLQRKLPGLELLLDREDAKWFNLEFM